MAIVALSPLVSSPESNPIEQGLYLVLEGIQDPGNMGTMIRTANAFAFDGVILAGPTVDPFGDKALRSAMGSAFHIPVYQSLRSGKLGNGSNPAGSHLSQLNFQERPSLAAPCSIHRLPLQSAMRAAA
ncbi:MAG: RNA methyltransferase [Clostridiales bacterium]|nr:RNA methyltransferase [Clostridiales bacterium]